MKDFLPLRMRNIHPLVVFPTETKAVVQSCSVKKGVLENFSKFTGKHLCQRPAILFKKVLWHRCFPVNFKKFSRTPFFYRTPLVAASVETYLCLFNLVLCEILSLKFSTVSANILIPMTPKNCSQHYQFDFQLNPSKIAI